MIYVTLPYAQITILNPDASVVTVVISDTLRLMDSPVKKSRKSGGKGSVALLKENIQFGLCIPRLQEIGNFGSNHAVKFSKATMRHAKIRERKGPSQGLMKKCVPRERIPWDPKFAERTQDETLKTGAMRPQRRMGRGKGCL